MSAHLYKVELGNSAFPGVSLYKWTHSTWNVQTKLRTFPLFYRVLQTKFEENRSIGFFAIAGHPKRHFQGKLLYICKVLAWETSFACRSQTKHFRGYNQLPCQNFKEIGQEMDELWSDIPINKQRLLLYIYTMDTWE